MQFSTLSAITTFLLISTATAATTTTSSSTTATSKCNHAGCGTAEVAAFAAPTPAPLGMAALVGFGALGAAAIL